MGDNNETKETLEKGSGYVDATLAYSGGDSKIEETMAKPSATGATLPTAAMTYGQIDRKSLEQAEAQVAEEWKVGDVILDLYEVKEELGEGGFGKVHRVRHRGWNTDLAVKSLRKDLIKDKVQRKTFIHECEGWVNLGLHPQIVSCYYVRDLGGLPRIFSELMEGGSLEDWIEQGKVEEWKQIIDIAIQCLDGLDYAHNKGLIHRDIKPVNCLMSKEGDLKITDFGIASGLATLGFDVTESKVCDMTKTMMFKEGAIGTPAYMPPEQWDRQYGDIGPWSDIYAFGVMLFEMCCDERPFDEGGDDIGVLKIRHTGVEAPNPKEIREDIPEKLSGFILKCLRKKTDERFLNCDSARDELVKIYIDFLKNISTPFYHSSFNQYAGSVYFVSFSPNGLYALLRIESLIGEDTLMLWEIKTGKFIRTFNQYAGSVNSVSISPDGLYALSGSGDKTLKLWEIKTGKCIRTFEGHISYVYSVSISPDGQYALSGSNDKTLRLWDIKTGKCIRILEGHTSYVYSVSFSPDGRYALSGSDDQTLRLWEFEWEHEFPEMVDWDEGARPYLENFLTLHTPYAGTIPTDREPTKKEITLALTKVGKPVWTDEDFQKLLEQLGYAGYGWLRPEGVRRELEKMAEERKKSLWGSIVGFFKGV